MPPIVGVQLREPLAAATGVPGLSTWRTHGVLHPHLRTLVSQSHDIPPTRRRSSSSGWRESRRSRSRRPCRLRFADYASRSRTRCLSSSFIYLSHAAKAAGAFNATDRTIRVPVRFRDISFIYRSREIRLQFGRSIVVAGVADALR